MATLTITPIKTFISGETVTPAKLNELSQSAVALTAGTIVDADVSPSAAIAASKLSTAAQQALLPAGAVMPFARATAPAGWLIANGDAVPNGSGTVQGVTADFSALYAAVSTSFGTVGTLPDLRGIFVRGSGDQTISGTLYSKAFALKEADELKSHSHTYTRYAQIITRQGGGDNNIWGSTASISTSAFGGDETRPANIALLYCIKF
jgi:microcystin-dependent protein